MIDTSWLGFFAAGFSLCLVQFLAAIPWVTVLSSETFTLTSLFRGNVILKLGRALLGLAVAGGIAAAGLWSEQDADFLTTMGRWYGVVLYCQLILDFFVLVLGFLLLFWPRGGAVALAAFREGIRQPMFYFIGLGAMLMILIMPFIPYFTFGEDIKMVKELGYDVIMLAALLFGILAASISISEEIEGRTAITLMSKPVSRRQFLIGKFLGILLASLLMTGMLSVAYLLVLWYKPIYDRDTIIAPLGLLYRVAGMVPLSFGPSGVSLIGGAAWWFSDVVAASPGVILGFCQVMVLLAIAVALATRLPMVVNLVTCLVIFLLGHLTPVLEEVSRTRFALVHFMAQLFDTLLPGLELFNIGPALTRDILPPAGDFALYVGSVLGYAVLYTTIALLFGLILFEDRDLA
jgi:ABC-type transport system involved in multi-copper enzyme maturation permease subunit